MSLLRRIRRHVQLTFALTAALIPMLLAAPAQAGGYTSRHATWYVSIGVETRDYGIQGMAFLPSQIWINAGDTVVWTVATTEPHTVTFPRPGQGRPAFNPADPNVTMRRGGSSYTGRSYYNSGLLSIPIGGSSMGGMRYNSGSMGYNSGSMGYNSGSMGYGGAPSYRLTFGVTGNFGYYCLVHSTMYGVVHVRPSGTPYPYSPADYAAQGRYGAHRLLDHGYGLAGLAERLSSNTVVTTGIGDGYAMAVRFFPYTIWVRVGQTVTFVNRDSETPHTVTFGAAHANTFMPYGNRSAFNGTSPLNSGYIGSSQQWFGTTFRVTFTRVGRFPYHCALHGTMGMYGTVIVLPR
ncbi:MAG: plastocyanin [Ktedonobacterales bacterium]|nr:plastocyanin [Ktedonobacterales bacterium]